MMKINQIYKLMMISLVLLQTSVFAQDQENEFDGYTTRLNLTYKKFTGGNKKLTATLMAKKEDLNLPVDQAEIIFYAGDVELGKKLTDRHGVAILEIAKDVKVPANDTGAVVYRADYKALSNSTDASSEIVVVDLNLELSLEEVDSVRTITIKATKTGKNEIQVPVLGMEINVYVRRLFSDLKVGSVTLDDTEGVGSTEFTTIPGDSAGNILIVAKVDDNEVFSNVETVKPSNWGTKVSYDIEKNKRELWTNEAPLWMAITLAVFLLGVWYHLVRVFIKMYKVKKLGVQEEKKE
ncbi:MAG: hypothetical protein U0W24_16015 [Bacteroidales bacterium]